MKKLIGTLAALATLVVQLTILSSMIMSETPPPAVQAALKAVEAIGSFMSEETLTGKAPPPQPQGVLPTLWYGLHISSTGAWRVWIIICLSLGVVVFVGSWAFQTIDWGFLDFDDAVDAIKSALNVMLLAAAVKLLWLMGRFACYQLALGAA